VSVSLMWRKLCHSPAVGRQKACLGCDGDCRLPGGRGVQPLVHSTALGWGRFFPWAGQLAQPSGDVLLKRLLIRLLCRLRAGMHGRCFRQEGLPPVSPVWPCPGVGKPERMRPGAHKAGRSALRPQPPGAGIHGQTLPLHTGAPFYSVAC